MPDREEGTRSQEMEETAVAHHLQPLGTDFCWGRDEIPLSPCSSSSKWSAGAVQRTLSDELLAGLCKQGHGENGPCLL